MIKMKSQTVSRISCWKKQILICIEVRKLKTRQASLLS